jgi:hypothetical protein
MRHLLDLLHNLIRLIKLPFLASLSANFSGISSHMTSKFDDKSAQKLSIFSSKAGYVRGLFIGFLILAAILPSCQTKTEGSGPWVKKIDSEELSRIIINFSTKMKIDKHLELEDSWASYDDYITRVCVQYSSQRLLTLYDARLLMVEVVEELLYRLNHNQIVSFELDHFPFTAKDLDVKITFESFYGRYLDEQYIGLAWLQADCVHFYAFDRKDRSYNGIDWDHHRFEPYSKSRELALIKKQADLPHIREVENPSLQYKPTDSALPGRYISPFTY